MTTPTEAYLTEHRFFAGLPADTLGFLACCARERELTEGEILIRHGDRADAFYVVRTGRIAREVPAIQGPPFVMESLGAGDVLGWSWLIPPYQWSFQARADAATLVLQFDGPKVLERCESEAKFGYALLKRFSALMSERLVSTRRKMVDEWSPPGFG
jgi:CRP-like cAMP-binding protein